ncbi:MAG: tripartite tricarboxylate transporter permease [Alphaproteobacteria bacterium]|nr:tripartite tricarboxylate transporter permease [Alphaproteobacteria bacterium]
METLFMAITLLLDWQVVLAILIGSLGGVIIGAIPGVGPAVAIAILLPVTFSLEPLVGLTLLLGIYGSSMYGGAIPAILINVPGTAANALTTYDGYALTKQGRAPRALVLAYSASFFGGVVSIICLMLLSSVLVVVAPQFGAREIMLAALLGMLLVVIAHRGKTLLALLMLGLGVFLNNVGFESIRYTHQFTFGQTWLASGFDLIVVILGLFALSQAFLLLTARKVGRGDDAQNPVSSPSLVVGSAREHFRAFFRHRRVASVSAGFGVLMGMIPGVGEFTAQFLGYTYAQRTSKTPDQFGKGAEEGLVASETANNAVPAAALIPLLALGIPGEALTAMMLSVFYVHGVVPGPQLFEGKLDFILALYIVLLLLNVLVLVFLMVSTRWLVRVIDLPPKVIGICILVLSFVGVYALRNSVVDCLIAAGFGIFGCVLKQLNWPIVPIILGMVLGGILEVKSRAALARIDGIADLVSRPVSLFFMVAIVLVLVVHFVGIYRRRG